MSEMKNPLFRVVDLTGDTVYTCSTNPVQWMTDVGIHFEVNTSPISKVVWLLLGDQSDKLLFEDTVAMRVMAGLG